MSGLREAFAGLGNREKGTGNSSRLSRDAAKTGHPSAQVPKTPLPLQGTAKSKHPEFEAVKVYVRSSTRKRAFRRWEDEDGGDFSDLVEKLLQEYADA